jgi:hypothetical protein
MKIVQLIIQIILFVCSLANTFEDNNEGLCLSNSTKACSTSMQKYGVCCSKDGTSNYTYYRNCCLACNDVFPFINLGLYDF